MYLLRALIGSLDCLRLLWLVRVITLVFVLRHSIENHSNYLTAIKDDTNPGSRFEQPSPEVKPKPIVTCFHAFSCAWHCMATCICFHFWLVHWIVCAWLVMILRQKKKTECVPPSGTMVAKNGRPMFFCHCALMSLYHTLPLNSILRSACNVFVKNGL